MRGWTGLNTEDDYEFNLLRVGFVEQELQESLGGPIVEIVDLIIDLIEDQSRARFSNLRIGEGMDCRRVMYCGDAVGEDQCGGSGRCDLSVDGKHTFQ